MQPRNFSSYFYLIWGAALILLSMLTCMFSVWLALPNQVMPISAAVAIDTVTVTSTPTPPPLPADTATPVAATATVAPTAIAITTRQIGESLPAATATVFIRQPPTSTPISTSVVKKNLGVVTTDSGRVNLRSGPSVNYGQIGRLNNGDEVAILQRTAAGDWLQIQAANQPLGWVAEQFIEITGQADNIPVAQNLPPTPSGNQSKSDTPSADSDNSIPELDVYRGQVAGNMTSYTEKWFTFFEGSTPGSITLILMFDPNVNLNADAVHFFIYDEQYIPDRKIPQNADSVPNIGSGSRPAADRDGDAGNGELIWSGATLQSNRRYYLRLVNGSTSTLQYCLATQDVFSWVCPR